jgi:hypothetical protein
MKTFKSLKRIFITGLFLFLFLGIVNNAQSWPRFVVGLAPVEVVTVCPGPNFVWIKGHYKVNIWGNFVWVPGHWLRV